MKALVIYYSNIGKLRNLGFGEDMFFKLQGFGKLQPFALVNDYNNIVVKGELDKSSTPLVLIIFDNEARSEDSYRTLVKKNLKEIIGLYKEVLLVYHENQDNHLWQMTLKCASEAQNVVCPPPVKGMHESHDSYETGLYKHLGHILLAKEDTEFQSRLDAIHRDIRDGNRLHEALQLLHRCLDHTQVFDIVLVPMLEEFKPAFNVFRKAITDRRVSDPKYLHALAKFRNVIFSKLVPENSLTQID